MKKFSLHLIWIMMICCSFKIYAQIGVTKYGTNALANNGVTGDYNTGLGFFALGANTSGNRNTGAGANVLRFNTTGLYNTATGAAALYQNTTGGYNSGFGAYALFTNTTGYRNTAFGNESMRLNTTGYFNTAFGDRALYSTTTGNFNTGLGATALFSNTTGYQNTASGEECLYHNSTGFSNTGSGYRSLYENTTGIYNTAYGYHSLFINTTGYSNTAVGVSALVDNTNGDFNTAIGQSALGNNSTGSYNIAVGYAASNLNTTGIRNTVLGSLADVSSGNLTNATAIGYTAVVTGSNRVRIGNSSITSIGGQVGWTIFSDGRYKEDVKEDVPGLTFINSLRPVSYTVNVKGLNDFYRKATGSAKSMEQSEETANKIIYNGFVAQEVELAAKELNFEFSGVDKPETKDGLYGLRYDNFISPMVKAMQELSAKNDELQSQINELKALIAKGANGSSTSYTAYLKQNAPNPFNSNTVIQYYIPDNAKHAQIRIIDVTGRVVKTFNAPKGEGKINIGNGELAAGNYSYTLYVDNKTADTKQMLLLK